jgi:uncharacterized repeat protein (TIGR02543 family)
MKRTIFVVMAILAVFSIVSISCDNGTTSETPSYEVTFSVDGGTPAPAAQKIKKGGLVTEPSTAPTRAKSFFVGWYKDAAFNTPWVFATEKVTAKATIYARWLVLPDGIAAADVKALAAPDLTSATEGDGWFGWATNGVDNKVTALEMSALKAAKYLIIETKGLAANGADEGEDASKSYDGIGGIKISLNGDGNSWGGDETELVAGGYVAYVHVAADTIIFVVKLDALTGYDDAFGETATQLKLNIGYWPLDFFGFKSAYLAGGDSVAVAPEEVSVGLGVAGALGFAYIPGQLPGPKYTVSFDVNGATGDAPEAIRQTLSGVPITLPSGEGLALSGKVFAGWGAEAGGYAIPGTSYLPEFDITLFAIWVDVSTAGIEKVTLNNAWYVVYTFTLPSGKTWADYSRLEASYMLLASEFDHAVARGARLMGPYNENDFTRYAGTYEVEDGDPSILLVANYNGGKNAEFILDNTRGSSPWGSFDAGSLKNALAAEGIEAEGGKWFTIPYNISGSAKHGSYAAVNLPKSKNAGPFYFGVGLPGQGDLPNTCYMKDVTLVGYTATDSVKGIPTWLKGHSGNAASATETLPVFTGYNTPDGTNGFKEAYRDDSGKGAAKDITPVSSTLTFKKNYTGATDDIADATVDSYKNLPANTIPTIDDPPRVDAGKSYVVSSWNTSADGNGAIVSASSWIRGNTTIFAQWEECITITLNPNYGTEATTDVKIGKGRALGDNLVAVTRTGFVQVGWNTKADGTGSLVTKTTTFSEDTEIFAKWIAQTTDKDFVIGKKTGGSDDADLVLSLFAANGASNAPAAGIQDLTGNVLTITNAYVDNADATGVTRLAGVDNIGVKFTGFPENWQSYQKVVVDYTLTFAPGSSTFMPTGNQLKTGVFYAVGDTAGTGDADRYNYFDLDGSNTPPLELTGLGALPSTTTGLLIKCNPYGFGSGKYMTGIITLTINKVTLVAFP